MQRHLEHPVKPEPQTGIRGVAAVTAGALALLIDASANNMVNSGLPFLAGRVAATPDESSWLLTAYNAAYYTTILLSPWLYICVGRKRLLSIALAGFAITSVALVAATSLSEMVALRFVQGTFAGCMFVPAALLMFLSLPPKLMPVGIPAFAMFSLGGASLGSLIGGFFAETYGAGSVFVPGALATAVILGLVLAFSPGDGRTRRIPFDAPGVALSFATFGALQYLANEGERRNWFDDGSVVAAAAVFACSVVGLIAWEGRASRFPHVNLSLFGRHPNLAIGTLINVLVGFLGYSTTLFVAYLQQTLGATATEAGQMVALRIVTYLVGIPLAFVVVRNKWLDIRVVLSIAAIATAASFYSFSRLTTSTSAIGSFVIISLLLGLAFGALNQPAPSLVLGGMPPSFIMSALAIYKLSAPIGLMIATGFCTTFLDHESATFRTQFAGSMNTGNAAIAQFLAHGGKVAALSSLAGGQAAVSSNAALMIFLAGVTLCVIPAVMLVKSQSQPDAATPPAASGGRSQTAAE